MLRVQDYTERSEHHQAVCSRDIVAGHFSVEICIHYLKKMIIHMNCQDAAVCSVSKLLATAYQAACLIQKA